MSTNESSVPRKRRPKKVLSPSAKYEIWLQLVRGEATIAQAAATAGVDRSTITGYGRSPRTVLWRRWPLPSLLPAGQVGPGCGAGTGQCRDRTAG